MAFAVPAKAFTVVPFCNITPGSAKYSPVFDGIAICILLVAVASPYSIVRLTDAALLFVTQHQISSNTHSTVPVTAV